ncbi:hypothetical protein [Ideonella livida]|uniref:Uncharacterized protein n=1 Tax=Ideonella livida TaxID=2707176 RepID=A0A7C9TGL4_9BURK|nr:hypothetical protein [Ideonella livida]NDY89758.1 hypothetical protein [Ideonella livida]
MKKINALVNILACVYAGSKAGGLSGLDVSEQIGGACIQHLQRILVRFHADGLISIHGWTRRKGRGPYSPVWGAPIPEDVAYPGEVEPDFLRSKAAAVVWPDLIAFGALVKRLRAGPASVADLHHACGLTPAAIRSNLNRMKGLRLASVVEWVRREGWGGSPTPLWGMGVHNVERPIAYTNAERCARYHVRTKLKANPRSAIRATWEDALAALRQAKSQMTSPGLAEVLGVDPDLIPNLVEPGLRNGKIAQLRGTEGQLVFSAPEIPVFSKVGVRRKAVARGVTVVSGDDVPLSRSVVPHASVPRSVWELAGGLANA